MCYNPTPEPQDKTLSLTASMPGEGSQTRLALAETAENNISVKWKEGDVINLCFVSGTTVKTVSSVAVTHIREEGQKADFAVNIPEGITPPFNLYGVYGAAFNGTNTKEILFPAAPAGAALTDAEPLCVMRFAAEIPAAASPVSVSFTHLGSLLGVWLTNSATTDYALTSLSIAGNDSYNWLYNASGQAVYDIATGTFTDAKAGNTLTFPVTSATLAAGVTTKVYAWIVPTAASDITKAMTATLNGTAMTQTLPAKAFEEGKYYRLKLIWDGTVWKYLKLPPAGNLVAHWKFDGDANDAVGTNHGVVTGATLTTDRFGNADKAYSFTGSSYIDCVQPGILGQNARSFSFWAKTDNSLSNSEHIVLIYGNDAADSGERFELGLFPDALYVDISTSRLGKKAENITDGNWHFYAVTFESNGTLESIRYYMDGILLQQNWRNVGHLNLIINTGNKHNIRFGSYYNISRTFYGDIDDIRMYDKALSAEEVLGLYYSE